jgi:predicted alpha/beta superfamily hydrolase
MMKKILAAALGLSGLSLIAEAGILPGAEEAIAKAGTKRIIVTAPWDTPTDEGIFITGNTAELCQWKPRCLQLTEVYPHVFAADIPVSNTDQGFYFKITRGSWEVEATDGIGRPPQNSFWDPSYAELVFNVTEWRDRVTTQVSGSVQLVPAFYSPQLNNTRNLRIWLPPSYAQNKNKRYPVLYMHDGQNLFDPATSSSGRADWNIDRTMLQLLSLNLVPEVIVVGMDCTSRRFDEYDWMIQGRQYADFVIDTVKPWIDSHYRTLSDREHSYLMGSSMGAIISYSILWYRSDVFSRAGSPSLPTWANHDTMFRTVAGSEKPKLPFKILMSHGTFNGDANYAPGAQAFYKMMREQFGVTEDELTYVVYPYADHFEADWARQMPDFLRFLLN